jgi:uncharacterized protein
VLGALAALGAGASLGALSSVHCGAMCGPLVAVSCRREGHTDRGELGSYLLGRAAGYVLVGGAAAAVGAPLVSGAAGRGVQLTVAGLVAVVLVVRGVTLLRHKQSTSGLVTLGRGTSAQRWLAGLVRMLPRRSGGLGLATALFPCGALWTALLAAVATGSMALGALSMAAFAIASSPSLVLPSVLASRVQQLGTRRRWVESAAGVLMLMLAIWVVGAPIRSIAQARASADSAPVCAHCHR